MTEPKDCLESAEHLTPLTITNRSGLHSLRYRVGTHSAFLDTMRARLWSQDSSVVGALTSDTTNNFADALLDAWATVADVLTFYQERIANEGYLRTATEHRSLVELARLVGYVPRPGVAASVYLAYTVEKDLSLQLENGQAGSLTKEPTVTIPLGTRAQTIPGPGELPQTFETAEDLEARASWNKLKPRLTRPQHITPENVETLDTLYIDGVATGLKTNDLLLFVFRSPATPFYRRIAVVHDPDTDKKRTKVTLQPISQLRAVAKAIDSFVSGPHKDGQKETQADKARQKIVDSLKQEMVGNAPPKERLARIDQTIATLERIQRRSGARETDHWLTNVVLLLKKSRSGTEGKNIGGTSLIPDSVGRLSQKVYDVLGKIPPPKETALSDRLPRTSLEETNPVKVYAFRMKASLFGHNAPKKPQKLNDKSVMEFGEWPVKDTKTDNVLYLDASYDKIVPNSWAVLEYSPHERILVTPINTVDAGISRAAFGITGKSTRVTLSSTTAEGKFWFQKGDTFDVIRQTVVYAQSEELRLTGEPIVAPIGGKARTEDKEENRDPLRIDLDGYVEGLKTDRWLIVSGEAEDTYRTAEQLGLEGTIPGSVTVQGVKRREVVRLAAVEHGWPTRPETEESKNKLTPVPGEVVHTSLLLANELQYRYKRETVEIYGNVVRATHGETRKEILGSGNAGKALQRFALSHNPLTYTAASTPTGSASSLKVYVNDVQWHEADDLPLTDLGPSDRRFVVHTDDEQKTTIVFGDGKKGARLPTGAANVSAEYRTGIGNAGNVEAERIRLLMTRPLGVKEVDNPVRASGGADPEQGELIRENASLGVMAFGRVVSVQDYEDFARGFAGIGKARAELLRHRRQQFIHLTIAGIDDSPIDKESDLYKKLIDALRTYGDPHHQFLIDPRELLVLVLSANIVVLREHQWITVEEDVRASLLKQFSFANRALGQDAFLSEVISTIQKVHGVQYVDVDVFGRVPPQKLGEEGQGRLLTFPELDRLAVNEIIAALEKPGSQPGKSINVDVAAVRSGQVRPAQLAYIPSVVPNAIVLKQRLT